MKPSNYHEVLTEHPMVRSAEVSPDGQRLMCTHFNLSGWQINKSGLSPLFLSETLEGASVRFSPDGKLVAMGSEEPSINIIESAPPYRLIAELPHSNVPDHCSWSPDGRRLVSSDISAITKIWDVGSKQVTTTLRGTVAEFAPDGQVLAVGGQGSKFIGDEEHVGRVTLHFAPTLEEIDQSIRAAASAAKE